MKKLDLLLAALYSTLLLAGPLDKTGTLWAPYLEWSFSNSSYSGNPFDLVASAVFTHSGSDETRTTELFYNGNNTWKMRFTATRTGEWTFMTSSSNVDLNGHSGSVIVNPNPNPEIMGFLSASGNKYVRQTGENGERIGVPFNVYMNHDDFASNGISQAYGSTAFIQNYVSEALDNGCNSIFIAVCNSWFKLGTIAYNEHSNVDPDLGTFKILDSMVVIAHRNGISLHMWAWGDEARRWTPIGVGGINGTPDRRLQRYIASRLGPLPGWTMGYGFDLQEWVSESQTGAWSQYIHSHSGWQHLLCARGRSNSALDIKSYSNLGPRSYSQVMSDLNSDVTRPHFYEERDLYTRSVNMDQTRSQMWLYTLAGGMGGFWGILWSGGPDYPHPEQLRTHLTFWNNRFLVDMSRANGLTDGYCLKTPDNKNFVFYRENTSSIQMDLSGMSGGLPAVAVDCKKEYAEIAISVRAGSQTWNAPYNSDWAIAVGNYGEGPSVENSKAALETSTQEFTIMPNPVNPNAVFGFNVPSQKRVTFKIYTTGGSLIRTLIDRAMLKGSYRFRWNAHGLHSGVYMARLLMGEKVLTKKLLVLK